MKTLNNNKIKHKFSKTNLIAHNQAFSHKGLKLATDQQSTKAKATIRNTKHNPFSQNSKILTFWPMCLLKRSQTIPKFNSFVSS